MNTLISQVSLQNQILELINSSNYKIQVAVSWFTDETLLRKLISKAPSTTVEVLTSGDEMNLLRHDYFRQLKNAGATVRKLGSSSPLDGDFMHSKFIIIDNAFAFGGSYNFTSNARSNYETFKRWDRSELAGTIYEFNNWMSKGVDFFCGISDAEAVVRKLKEKFLEEQRRNERMAVSIGSMQFSEEQYMKKREDEIRVIQNCPVPVIRPVVAVQSKEEALRKAANQVSTQVFSVSSTAAVVSGGTNVVRPHSFHGGTAIENVSRKRGNYYALACYQKYHIDKNYSCFKTSVIKGKVVCSGEIQPTSDCDKYKVKIEFFPGRQPQVFIKSPDLPRNNEIHVYNEGFLCLFDPSETYWKDTLKMSEYTIPWLVEWILYYELWKITGKWEGRSSSH